MRSLILLALAAPLAAQGPVRLDRPDAEFAEPFSSIIGLRELSDGRVIVADALEQSVARLDFRTGDMTLIGRQGGGPGEYGAPGRLYGLPGDTTLMFDFANARAVVITPDGRMSSSTISFAGDDGALPAFPQAMDGRGRFYGTASIQFGNGGPTAMPDSQPVVRWVRGGAMDTLFRLPLSGTGMSIRISGGNVARIGSGGNRQQAFAPRDAWVVTPDGRVAIVRAEPYRIEWIGPNGRRQPGPTIDYEPVRITQRDKEDWADRQGGQRMMVRTPQGGRTLRTARPDLDDVDFPEVMPAFERAVAGPDGTVWARVSRPAGSAERYDVFDGQGRRVRQVELPAGRQLVGFGAGTLYAVRVDDDDLQWVERYRVPGNEGSKGAREQGSTGGRTGVHPRDATVNGP